MRELSGERHATRARLTTHRHKAAPQLSPLSSPLLSRFIELINRLLSTALHRLFERPERLGRVERGTRDEVGLLGALSEHLSALGSL